MTEQEDIDDKLDVDGKRWSMGRLFAIVMLVYVALFGGWKWAHAAEQPWDTNITTWNWDGSCGIATCTGFELQHSTTATGNWVPLASLAPTVRSFTVNGVSEGPHCYRLITVTTLKAYDSGPSNVSCKTNVKPAPPPPPVPNTLVTVGGSVWEASPNYTTFSWKLGSVVGTIPPKMKCDATRKIGSEYFRVTAPITWAGSRKDYVVARCALQ